MHPRNRHQDRYNLKELAQKTPELSAFIIINKFQDESIDFANPKAVKALNKAILAYFYNVNNWDIPPDYLCPPIPGRADYLHVMADLVGQKKTTKVLDIGVGANCVYPLIGSAEYGWHFVGSDIDPKAVSCAQKIIAANPQLQAMIEIRQQINSKHFFQGILKDQENFDFSMCNPPFHESLEEAIAGSKRKWQNLGKKTIHKTPALNFGGQGGELWCPGGEKEFIGRMIEESSIVKNRFGWFSSLVSKQTNLPYLYKALKQIKAWDVKTLDMSQGQKKSRIIAWTFNG